MRHQIFGRKLSRDIDARKALANNLVSNLFDKGQITTTLTKAKFARSYSEKLITRAKKNKLKDNRYLASLVNHTAFIKLTREIGPGFAKRVGGYTRIIKLTQRLGDAAPTARLELLEYEKKPAVAPHLGQADNTQRKSKTPKAIAKKSAKIK